MSTALNQAFMRNPNGLTNFLHRRPMLVEAQSVTVGTVHNPHTGTIAAQRVAIAERLAAPVQPSANANVRVLDAQVFYCDFEFFDVLQNARGTQYSRPKLVCPGLSITPDVNKVPMYYLPWREDKRFSMELGNGADYFMTAGMHGCKFEVNHNPATNRTIVSHTNIQPQATPNPVFVQQHVSDGLTQLTTDDAFAQACPHVLTFGKINYFWDAIRESGRIHTTMLGHGVQTDEIEEASPSSYQANVVGVRNGHNWTFYYQLTLMVRCQMKAQVKKKKWLGLKSYWDNVRNQMIFDVVVAVKRIWPAPTADIAILPD
jgi:hypothetical protein